MLNGYKNNSKKQIIIDKNYIWKYTKNVYKANNKHKKNTGGKMEQKQKIGVAITCLVCVCLAGMIFIYHDQSQKNEKQAINNGIELKLLSKQKIEYGSNTKPLDLVKHSKGKLTATSIDTKKLGKQKITYTLSAEGYKKKYTKWIDVVDTQKPTLKVNADIPDYLEIGQPFSISSKDIEATDKVDGRLQPVIKNQVNTRCPGKYKVYISATDKNGNTTKKTYTIEVGKPQVTPIPFDASIGTKIDTWSQYNSSSIIVRDRTVQLVGNPSQAMIEAYVAEFNSAPQYLLDQVDVFVIAPQSYMAGLYGTDTADTVYGHTAYAEGKTTVVLNSDKHLDDNSTLIHECAHAYDAKAQISGSKQFKKLFHEEKGAINKLGQSNIKEYFAYTYEIYVMKGPDALSKLCPKTAWFYEKYDI